MAIALPSPCAALIAAATSSHASCLRLEMTTLAPCSAIASAIARPIPREEPVTIATLPVRSNRLRAGHSPFVPSEVEGRLARTCLDVARHERAWVRVNHREHAWRIRSGRSSGCGPRPARRRGAGCGCRPSCAASGVSWLTPAPPNAWIASSMICSAMRGALTLIIAISALAALLPALSIRSAALRHSRRVQSISIRASATRCSQMLCSLQPLAEGDARLQPPHHRLERFFRRADGAHAMVDAARPEAALRDLEPPALAEQQVRRGHADVLELDFHMAVRRVVIAIDGQRALDRDPRRVHRHEDHRLLAGGGLPRASVLPIRMATLQRGSPAPDDHHLRPLMT